MLRKFFTLLLVMVCMHGLVEAQKPAMYSFQSSSGTYTPLTGATRLGTARAVTGLGASMDDTSFLLPSGTIPFTFTFDSTGYTSIYVCSNGYITFGSTRPDSSDYEPLASSLGHAGIVCAFGNDLHGVYTSTDTGQINYATVGTSPNREFVIEWKNVKPWVNASTNIYKLSFQIRLKEDNTISMVYYCDSIGSPTTNSFDIQVGLRGANNTFNPNIKNRSVTNGTNTWATSAAGTSSTSICYFSKTNNFGRGLTYKWLTPIAKDIAYDAIISPFFANCPSSNNYAIVRSKNMGLDTLFFNTNNYNVYMSLSGTASGNYSKTVSTGSLAPGATRLDTLSNSVPNTAAGIYLVRAWGSMSADNNKTNDSSAITPYAILNKSVLPITEGFDSATLFWTVQQLAGAGNWGVMNGAITDPTISPRSGNRMAFFNSYNLSAGTSSRLISPCINLDSTNAPILDFFLSQSSGYLSDRDSLLVRVSTDGGSTWSTPLLRATRANSSATTAFFRRYSVCMSNYKTQQNVKIGFDAISAYGENMVLEDVRMRDMSLKKILLTTRTTVCAGDKDTIYMGVSDTGTFYQLYAGASPLGSPISGNSNILTFVIPSVTTTTTYKILATDSLSGCSAFLKDTVVITANSLPNVNLGNDTGICQGTSITLNPNSGGGNTYQWSNSANTSTINVNSAGIYWVKVTNSSGCFRTDTMELTIKSNPSLNLGPDTAICAGSGITLDAGPNMAIYFWSTTASTRTITVSNPGNYFVTITDSNGCRANDAIMISMNPLPSVYLGPDTSFCGGNLLTLDAGAGFTKYQWSNGDTTRTTQASSTNIYTVQVTNNFGCVNSDGISVTVFPLPNVNLGGNKDLCYGDSVILDAGNAGSTYLWSTNDTSRRITVKGSGNFSVDVTNSYGCTGSDAITTQVNALPYVYLGKDTSICQGDSILIGGPSDMAAYAWSNSDTVQIIAVYTPGTYSLLATDSNGCKSSDAVTIGVNPSPVVNITGNDTTVCTGKTVIFDAGAGFTSYQWSNGAVTRTITTGLKNTYFVVVKNSFGCDAIDSVKLSLDSVPNFSFNSTPTANRTFSFTPTITSGYTFEWTFGDGGTASTATPSHTFAAAGNYSVCLRLTNSRGCTDSVCSSMNVTSTGKLPEAATSVSAYPNPFSDGTVINVQLKEQAEISIVLYDITGREYVISNHEKVAPGQFTREVKSSELNLPAGMFTVKVSINGTDTYLKLVRVN